MKKMTLQEICKRYVGALEEYEEAEKHYEDEKTLYEEHAALYDAQDLIQYEANMYSSEQKIHVLESALKALIVDEFVHSLDEDLQNEIILNCVSKRAGD